MSVKITQNTTPEHIYAAHEAGAIVGKGYPIGVTTNAEDGISNFFALGPVWLAMQKVGMVLSLHGEDPDTPCMVRELSFLPTLSSLASDFSTLRIVMEHLTTRKAVEIVAGLPERVAATITVHHLVLTLDDLIGGSLQPHNFCKPVAQTRDDRKALIEAVTSGNPKFFFGSDSAPHLRSAKESSNGSAGIFSAPVVLPVLCQVFEEAGALGRLEDFISVYGASFYGLPLNHGTITVKQKRVVVPQEIDGIVPFMAGQALAWSVEAE
jgi:dihydroorotase